jgi:hypothetical protein
MLTPTESSDDDGGNIKCFISNNVVCNNVALNNVDKRKIAQALQSLIKNKQTIDDVQKNPTKTSAVADTVKFKFRMKFKPNSPQRSLLSAGKVRTQSTTTTSFHPHHLQQHQNQNLQKISPKDSSKTAKISPASIKTRSSGGPSRSSSSSSYSSQVEKCREIRDLHNSMERQRRVDLRHNFDRLKVVVPELADSEKASKLTILNKAANYCLLMATVDSRLTNERNVEAAKNALLRKKLQIIQKSMTKKHVAAKNFK